jgi:cephalosporin-C deacetylase-like acetyl esterase
MIEKKNSLGFAPSENPFIVENGGFYRRWLSMVDDLDYLKKVVNSVKSTTDNKWVPIWMDAGKKYEIIGDGFEDNNDNAKARLAYLQAKTFYSIGRFPGEITTLKKSISDCCIRAYGKASKHLDPPLIIHDIKFKEFKIRAHLRIPKASGKLPAVLIMCGADVFKEDRGWAGDHALNNGLASLVMDAPGTGENTFPWEPSSVKAWMEAVDYLASLPEIDSKRIGAFGISRGGYSVMQLAGSYPEMVKAVVAVAGHPFGYEMKLEELKQFVNARNLRSEYIFGEPDGPRTFPEWSIEKENRLNKIWSLSELGILKNIRQPLLMINGKMDHLCPIGNIYFMLENGPPVGRESRIYPDAGHCAFKYFNEWAPASFKWLKEKLN